jgi:hypothetical protein
VAATDTEDVVLLDPEVGAETTMDGIFVDGVLVGLDTGLVSCGVCVFGDWVFVGSVFWGEGVFEGSVFGGGCVLGGGVFEGCVFGGGVLGVGCVLGG